MVVRRTILFVFFLLISLIAIYMMVIAINSIEKRGAYDALAPLATRRASWGG